MIVRYCDLSVYMIYWYAVTKCRVQETLEGHNQAKLATYTKILAGTILLDFCSKIAHRILYVGQSRRVPKMPSYLLSNCAGLGHPTFQKKPTTFLAACWSLLAESRLQRATASAVKCSCTRNQTPLTSAQAGNNTVQLLEGCLVGCIDIVILVVGASDEVEL